MPLASDSSTRNYFTADFFYNTDLEMACVWVHIRLFPPLHFCNGNNFCGFLFVSLDNLSLSKSGLLLNEIFSRREKFFL